MTENKRFIISDGENYWSKYEEFVKLYNTHTLSIKEVFAKLKVSNKKFNTYRKRGFAENRLVKRSNRRKKND